ncbi:MAG: WD40 repeat domain-containing protein [Planctomycetaceae bacterium]|nr:WD40 repeat domain-containing protein [Planctomycetaceae bacterium]MCB9940581.1 WD40 repeat domain-containing protein [Planctomycetaceae bacterium]
MSRSAPMFVAILFVSALTRVAVAADEAKTIATHDRWVTSVAHSSDGAIIATAGGQSLQYRPGDVLLWDAKSGNLIAALEGHTSNVWSVAFSPDGQTLVSSGYDGKVIVWSVAEKKSTATLEKHKGWCRSVAFHPGGKQFATAGEDGTAVIWDLEGPKEAKELKAHEAAIYQVAFSADGNTLATASTDKTVKLWDWQSGKENAKLEGNEDAVWCVAFGGNLIATGGADRKLRLFEPNGKLLATLPGHTDWISGVTFSPDAKTIATSSLDRSIRTWNVEQAIAAAPAVQQAAAKVKESKDQLQQAEDTIADSEPKIEPAKQKADILAAVVQSRVAAEVLAQSQEVAEKYKGNGFVKVDVEGAKKAADEAAAASAEKAKALEADKEFTELVKKLNGGSSADATKEKDAAVKAAADLEAGLSKAQQTKDSATKALADSSAALKDLSSKQSTPLDGFKSTVWTVSFSPDGKRLAAGSHKALRVWDLSTPQELFPHVEKAEATGE